MKTMPETSWMTQEYLRKIDASGRSAVVGSPYLTAACYFGGNHPNIHPNILDSAA